MGLFDIGFKLSGAKVPKKYKATTRSFKAVVKYKKTYKIKRMTNREKFIQENIGKRKWRGTKAKHTRKSAGGEFDWIMREQRRQKRLYGSYIE